MIALELALLLLALAAALFTRPWRLLIGGALLSPFLTSLVILPWLWAMPRLQSSPLQLQWSGACLLVLVLGWPLAVPTLVLVGLIAGFLAPTAWTDVVGQMAWNGVVPATLALALGAVLRRRLGTHPFVYVLGRAFLGTVACAFASASLAMWAGHTSGGVSAELSLVARWLMAWGDGFMTGMTAAIFVAYRPQWLATWSDRLYLEAPPRADSGN
jgi:uncharacterized membrane protein